MMSGLLRFAKKMRAWGHVPRDLGRIVRSYRQRTKDGSVCYHNWYPCNDYEDEWFHRFIVRNVGTDHRYHFFSVFGPRIALAMLGKNKVFVSGENVHIPNWPYEIYQDYALDKVNLSLGYDDIQDERYIRFPYWLLYMFEPVVDREMIRERIDEINRAENTRKFDCALIASHDQWNMRSPMYEALKDHLEIFCAGKWKHNTDDLWTIYNNDKYRYLSEFKFNICAENFYTPLYVTEKLFDAFRCGTIPLYAGAGNQPEPEIVNQDAVLLWKKDQSDHSAFIQEVLRLARDEAYYDKFLRQVRLLPYTEEFVYEKFTLLKERLLRMARA